MRAPSQAAWGRTSPVLLLVQGHKALKSTAALAGHLQHGMDAQPVTVGMPRAFTKEVLSPYSQQLRQSVSCCSSRAETRGHHFQLKGNWKAQAKEPSKGCGDASKRKKGALQVNMGGGCSMYLGFCQSCLQLQASWESGVAG